MGSDKTRGGGGMGIGMAIGTSCLCRFTVETDKISMTAFRCSNAIRDEGIREKRAKQEN